MSDDGIEEINSHTFDNQTIKDDDDQKQPSSTMVPDAIRKQLQQTRRSSWMVDKSPIDQSDMVHRADEVDESTTSNDKVQQSTTIVDDDTKVIRSNIY
jgi:hypothetical protein